MARFAAQYPGLTVGPYEFESRFTEKNDIQAVKTNLGQYVHGELEDQAQRHLPIDTRVSVFDTEQQKLIRGWSDAEEKQAIEFLRANAGQSFCEVTAPKAELPWNNYGDFDDPEKIVTVAQAIDADLALVRQYESENANRPEVLSAIDSVLAISEQKVVVDA